MLKQRPRGCWEVVRTRVGDRDEAGVDGCRVDVLVADVGVADLRAGQANGRDAVLVRDSLQTSVAVERQ